MEEVALEPRRDVAVGVRAVQLRGDLVLHGDALSTAQAQQERAGRRVERL